MLQTVEGELFIVLVLVYATMRKLSKSKALVEAAGCSLGRTLEVKQLDVCDENSIKACVDSLPERRVDVLSKATPAGLAAVLQAPVTSPCAVLDVLSK